MSTIVLFYDSSFPLDGQRPQQSFFDQMDERVKIVSAENLATALDSSNTSAFIHLHGSYFPKEAWNSILKFFHEKKGFVHTGGAPFRNPCYKDGDKWIAERSQTAYHQAINIHETLQVDSTRVNSLVHNKDIPVMADTTDLFHITDTYNFVMHPTKSVSIEHEMGSVGPMNATIHPLVKGITDTGREVAAPSVLIEHDRGTFAGARWIFINQMLDQHFWNEQGAKLLNRLTNFTEAGVTELWLKTTYANYHPGERATIHLQHQTLSQPEENWTFKLTIEKDGQALFSTQEQLKIIDLMQTKSFVIPEDVSPGFYDVTCELVSEEGEKRTLHQGYWGMDTALLSEGKPLTVGRDYFEKDGRPMPIVGMTYMTSDVARYFLFLPNPHVWDKDMAHMKRAGINYIRTGIWTAWRNMMFADGHMEEDVLRAIDAFILCAKKHDLHVTFNFFSFTPETWEGQNPYLDPRSIEAQKRFITAVVSRHTETTNIDWDLINEPSLFDPTRVFSGPMPLHDEFDREHYQGWLKNRHASIRSLQERWNMSPAEIPDFEAIEPPESHEINFGIRDMIMGKKGLKWLDYVLYTMDMHNQWAAELSNAIKKIAPNHMVTVGQDEALAGQRPSPFFYEEAVDYTTNHTWWLLDDLLWDGIFTKTPHKPNLIQETGIMYVEQPNNHAKRTEYELRNILERKYAYAFSTGGAGAVQWLWNTNYYMNNINESNIGAIRADGTEKPETDVSYDFGAFMKETKDLYRNRALEDVAVIFPYSNDFSNRSLAYDITTTLTRTLAYEMNVPFRGIGEYQLDVLTEEPPKLLIVPSPHSFDNAAFDSILEVADKQGITVLFTGPIHLDEYWHDTNRAEKLFGNVGSSNVKREDLLNIDGKSIPVSFGGERIADTFKGVTTDHNNDIQMVDWGKGKIIWSPLPVELNHRLEPIIALYQYGLKSADVSNHLKWVKGDFPGIYGRKLTFDQGHLFIFVSEFDLDTDVSIQDPVTSATYDFTVAPGRTVMFATDLSGKVTAIYRPDEVSVHQM